MSQNKRRKAQPKQKSRVWLIGLVLVMMLALGGGMLARNMLPDGIDLAALSNLIPQMPASNADVISQAVATYAQTSDVNQARSVLTGIDDAEVARQLTAIEVNTTDAATRQQASRLRRELGLSVVEPSAADLVLSQQTIWLTSALAALPFLAALALGLGSSVKTMITARLEEAKMTRARKAGRPAAQVVEEIAAEPVDSEPTAEQKMQADAAEVEAAAQAVAAKAKAANAAESKKLSLSGDPMGGDEVPAAIQGILSDVFGDETQQTRRTVLLQGLGDIPASQLLAACRQIADGLRMNRAGYRRRPGALQDTALGSQETQ